MGSGPKSLELCFVRIMLALLPSIICSRWVKGTIQMLYHGLKCRGFVWTFFWQLISIGVGSFWDFLDFGLIFFWIWLEFWVFLTTMPLFILVYVSTKNFIKIWLRMEWWRLRFWYLFRIWIEIILTFFLKLIKNTSHWKTLDTRYVFWVLLELIG